MNRPINVTINNMTVITTSKDIDVSNLINKIQIPINQLTTAVNRSSSKNSYDNRDDSYEKFLRQFHRANSA